MLVPSPAQHRAAHPARPKYTRRPGRLMRSHAAEQLSRRAVRTFRNSAHDVCRRRRRCRRPPSGEFSSTILNPWMYPSSSQDPRDLDLQLRRGHVHTRVLRGHGIAEPRQHVGNRVCHISISTQFTVRRCPFTTARHTDDRRLTTDDCPTSCASSHPRCLPAAPASGSTAGTGRTCAGTARGRTAQTAPVPQAHLELRLSSALSRSLQSWPCLSLAPGSGRACRSTAAASAPPRPVPRGRHDRHVHPARLVDLHVVDLRETAADRGARA